MRQIQALWRTHRAAGGAVAGGEGLGHALGRPGTGSYPFEGADQRADLIVQEAARPQGEAVFHAAGGFGLGDRQFIQRFQRAVRLTIGRAERGEIVQADHGGGGLLHRGQVQRACDLPDPAPVMGGGRAARQQAEQVATFAGRKPGVKIVRDQGRLQHRHGQGAQVPVQGLRQTVGIPVAVKVAMRDLTGGMHTGIGTACGGDGMGAGLQAGQRRLDRRLDRGLPGSLTLPALERAAVIVDFQGEARHGLGYNGANRKAIAPTFAQPLCLFKICAVKERVLGVFDVAGDVVRGLEQVASGLTAPFSEPVVRLGVTGLSRAGKTVFITGLVANLLQHGRMPQLRAAASGRLEAVYLQPQPDLTLPRFAYEDHLAAMTGDDPHWPQSTRAVSELRLSFRVRPEGFFAGLKAGFTGPRIVHVDIVDYPGEWLLDLGLLDKSFADWSEATLDRIAKRPQAAAFMAQVRAEDAALAHDEAKAQALAVAFTLYLQAARDAGWSDCTPGRFLLPGDLAGSPVLTFAPVPMPASAGRGSLWREMARRYEGYKARVVQPFFRDHFARVDRQVVLVDVLGAIHQGPAAVEDLRRTMADVLAAFRPGRIGWLSALLGGKRVEKILFAATKADHLHHSQHTALTAIMAAMLAEAKSRADFAGARTEAMSLAALRCTVEELVSQGGETLEAVRGRLMSGRSAVMYPGQLPSDPARLLAPARKGAETWLDADYGLMEFAPARMSLRPGEGPPHIRLDRAAEFLIGDWL